ncbi:MAG: hypothetical protein NVSMB65_13260 [Chloroflexota bacterium]
MSKAVRIEQGCHIAIVPHRCDEGHEQKMLPHSQGAFTAFERVLIKVRLRRGRLEV